MGTKQNRIQNCKKDHYFYVNILRDIYMYMLYHKYIMLPTSM